MLLTVLILNKMKIIIRDQESNSQALLGSWIRHEKILRDDALPQQGDLNHLAVKNAKLMRTVE